MIGVPLGFYDSWIWLTFIGLGLVMIILELIVGVETGLDLVFVGSAFILGGVVTWPFYSWNLTLIVTSMICVAYFLLGRRYVRRWKETGKSPTNIDAIIGKGGIVLKSISKSSDGLVRVGNEDWKARADDVLNVGDEIVVTRVAGVTLTVQKSKGGK